MIIFKLKFFKYSLTLLLCSATSFSQSSSSINIVSKLDSITNYIDDALNVEPGTSIIVMKDEQVLYHKSYGLSNVQLGTKNTVNTSYDLASIGKMFTGYAIAALENAGKIKIDDDIKIYLKDFPDYGHKITIENLVHHTSGIKNWTYLIQQDGWDFEDKITTDQMMRLIYAQDSLEFEPGEKYRYSNSGYVLLSKIIEVISNMPFEIWMKKNIFDPLDMQNTFFNTNHNKVITNMASAYKWDSEDNLIRESYNTSVMGSSSLISNALDMSKWMNFLLSPSQSKKVIVQKMFTTRKLNDGQQNNYAYGIKVNKLNGMTTYTHSGSWASFTSHLTIIPELNMGLFFANNFRTHTGNIMELYLEAIIPRKNEKLVNQNEKKTDNILAEKVITIPSEKLNKYVGKYKLGKAWYLDVLRKGNDLYAQANGERAFYMRPINDSTFVVKQYGNETITFIDNQTKQSGSLIYNNKEAKRKSTPFYFDRVTFEKYTGTYYSTELGILYEIFIKDNQMYYSSIKSGVYPIFFERDGFFFTDGKLSKILFDFGEKNKISGFYQINSKEDKLFYFKKAL